MRDTQLEYFVSVARNASFSKAAAELYVTQPVISQQIAALEKELGFDLFSRTTKGVQLTEAGMIYYRHAVDILSKLKAAKMVALEASKGNSGSIRIGILSSLPSSEFDLLKRFADNNPGVSFEFKRLTVESLSNQLKTEQIDTAYVAANDLVEDDELGFAGRGMKKLNIVCRKDHPLALKKTLKEEDLRPYRLILLQRYQVAQSRYYYPQQRFDSSTLFVEDLDIAMLMVRLGFGIAPEKETTRFFLPDDVTMVEVDSKDWWVEDGWAYLRANENPALHSLVSFLDAHD